MDTSTGKFHYCPQAVPGCHGDGSCNHPTAEEKTAFRDSAEGKGIFDQSRRDRKNRRWIQFDIGEIINIKGQEFILHEVDYAKSRLILESRVHAMGKEPLVEMMRRLSVQEAKKD